MLIYNNLQCSFKKLEFYSDSTVTSSFSQHKEKNKKQGTINKYNLKGGSNL